MNHSFLDTLSDAVRHRAEHLIQSDGFVAADDKTKRSIIERLIVSGERDLSLPLLHVLAHSPFVMWRDAGMVPWDSLSTLLLNEESYHDPAVCRAYIEMASRVPLNAATAAMLTEMLFLTTPPLADDVRAAMVTAAVHYRDAAALGRATPHGSMNSSLQDYETVAAALVRGIELYPTLEATAPLEAAILISPSNAPILEHVFTVVTRYRQSSSIVTLFHSGGYDLCFYDLLMSVFLAHSHPQTAMVDDEIRRMDVPEFAQRFLDRITAMPDATLRRHLATFHSLPWLDPNNPHLATIVGPRELPFLQLVFCLSLSVAQRQELLRWAVGAFSPEGRLKVLTRLDALPDLSAFSILIDLVTDSDPNVCAQALRQIYALKGAEVDYVFLRHFRTNVPEIRQAIYDLKPEFRARALLQQALSDPNFNDKSLARIVANIDHETVSVLETALQQPQAAYRAAGLRTLSLAGLLERMEASLVPLVMDRSCEVRATLAAVLRDHTPTETSRLLLQQLAHDSDQRVAMIAFNALTALQMK